MYLWLKLILWHAKLPSAVAYPGSVPLLLWLRSHRSSRPEPVSPLDFSTQESRAENAEKRFRENHAQISLLNSVFTEDAAPESIVQIDYQDLPAREKQWPKITCEEKTKRHCTGEGERLSRQEIHM